MYLAVAGAVLLALAATAISAGSSPAPSSTPAASAPASRYALAGGCYALRSLSTGRLVAKVAGGRYRAAATALGASEAFRAQATALGSYLFYGFQRDVVAAGPGDSVESAGAPSAAADWRVDGAGGDAFGIVSLSGGKALAVAAGSGDLVLVDRGSAGQAGRFRFEPRNGCPGYPEAEVNASGPAFKGKSPMAEVKGTIDGHTHVTSFEWFGGDWLCGRPWHRFGIPYALPDCAYIQGPRRSRAPAQNFLDYGVPVAPHDTRGWPTFHDWPSPHSLSEEMNYYTGIERAWRAGLRVMVSHTTGNEVFCEVLGRKPPRNPCNDMSDVRIQTRDLRLLENYIDAQSGGPGKGWFRIVGDPFQARRVINQGKLAVVPGMELSRVLGCGEHNDVPECDRAQIDRGLKELHDLGIRSLFPIHKFDNAFGGVKMDGGEFGVLVNLSNRKKTGHFWNVQTCQGPEHDNQQIAPTGTVVQLLTGPFRELLPPTAIPNYPPPPHCNVRGLTALGEYLLRRMMQQHFIIELDHMDALTGDQALSVIESKRYSGVISGHSWDSPEQNPRIYKLGGIVTSITGSAKSFVADWRIARKIRDKRFYGGSGFGYGADVNGLHNSPPPSGATPISYPFKSYDGRVTFGRERWGERVFDLNKDGVSNYGMLPDWLEELRVVGGRPVLTDMFHGAEAYLQMWERASGVPARRCLPDRARFKVGGLRKVRLRAKADRLLFGAGQPARRAGYGYRYCVAGRKNRRAKVTAAFTPRGKVGLVLSTARRHKALGVGRGSSAKALRGHARRFGRGLLVRRAGRRARFVYGVRGGRVRFVAVATRSVARKRSTLRRYLRLAR